MHIRSSTSEDISDCRFIIDRATCLIGDILHLSNSLLPPSLIANFQALPKLVNTAIGFESDPRIRSLASTTVSNLEKYAMIRRADETNQGSRLDYFGEIKKKLDTTMDETLFRQKINDSVS